MSKNSNGLRAHVGVSKETIVKVVVCLGSAWLLSTGIAGALNPSLWVLYAFSSESKGRVVLVDMQNLRRMGSRVTAWTEAFDLNDLLDKLTNDELEDLKQILSANLDRDPTAIPHRAAIKGLERAAAAGRPVRAPTEMEIDCSADRIRILNLPKVAAPWTDIPPDTNYALLENLVCKKP
jgi:hypothetical protein